MDYTTFVSRPDFFSGLVEIDRSTAEEAHGKPCSECGGKLDRANFWRSGHGLPAKSPEESKKRFSFCCRVDGCRHRHTPESVRFLRGMSYVAFLIVLLAALNNGPTAKRTSFLAASMKVSRQTVQRWIKWWREVFTASPLWRERRGEFMPSLQEDNLPQSLLDHFHGKFSDPRRAIEALLAFLAPLCPEK